MPSPEADRYTLDGETDVSMFSDLASTAGALCSLTQSIQWLCLQASGAPSQKELLDPASVPAKHAQAHTASQGWKSSTVSLRKT